MDQVAFFTWLQSAPAGLWAFSFVLAVGFIISFGFFIWRESNKLLSGMSKTNTALNNFKLELDNRIKELSDAINAVSNEHSREIKELRDQLIHLQVSTGKEIAKLIKETVSTDSLKRIELFLESMAARGQLGKSDVLLDALKFERQIREEKEVA